jgi:hypothetical protein
VGITILQNEPQQVAELLELSGDEIALRLIFLCIFDMGAAE